MISERIHQFMSGKFLNKISLSDGEENFFLFLTWYTLCAEFLTSNLKCTYPWHIEDFWLTEP